MNSLNHPTANQEETAVEAKIQSRRRFLLGGAAVIGGIMGYVAIDDDSNDHDTRTKTAAKNSPESEPTRNAPIDFDFQNYDAPQEFGKVLERKFYQDSEKTVIIIPDFHPEPESSSPEVLQQGYTCQEQTYRILNDLRNQLGSLRIVCENWSDDIDFVATMQNRPKDDAVFSQYDYDLLYELFHESDAEKRKSLVERNLGKTITPAPVLLTALYYPKVELLGSGTVFDIQRFLLLDQRFAASAAVLRNPGNFTCGPDQNLNFLEVQRRFANGDITPEVADCYCNTRDELHEATENLFKNRHKEAPQSEIASALRAPYPVVVVFTGALHLPEQRKILQNARVSHIVIAPNMLVPSFPAHLDEYVIPKHREYEMPDNAQKSCEQWRIDSDRKQSEALQKWFAEDE